MRFIFLTEALYYINRQFVPDLNYVFQSFLIPSNISWYSEIKKLRVTMKAKKFSALLLSLFLSSRTSFLSLFYI